jgi:hypothetical protein
MKSTHIELAQALAALPDRELIEVIYAAFRPRQDDRDFRSGDFERDRWCLAEASFGKFNGQTDEHAYVELIGLPAPAYEQLDWEHLSQQGKCLHCGVLVVSVSKVASCPVCSSDVECT